ncbi:MAG TPA: haloacid dehalogenase type II [Candidatus Limnocylindria bacterium]|nr:haloacid dehalogenase type II [Candidatus Limnocylindria bacterium]
MTDFDLGRFEVLTFDCYGTLIDWEAGILGAAQPILANHGVTLSDDEVLERFAQHEAVLESGPWQTYRAVLAGALGGLAGELGVQVSAEELSAFSESVPAWPPFPDSAPALRQLASRYRLGVITNCDDDLFAASAAQLGVPFEWVVTAEQAQDYKPNHAPFLVALKAIDVPPERVLHVAQSLYHDHVPAHALGLATVWVNRRHDRPGFGATPPADATPNLEVPDLASLAAMTTG